MTNPSILLVGGTWTDTPNENGEYGRPSSIVGFVYAALKDRHKITMFNGGNYAELSSIITFCDAYDIVFWWANIPDNTLPKIRDVKEFAPHVMLVTSKRNDDDRYSFMELTQHALARKANLTFEFKRVPIEIKPGHIEHTFHVMVFDPLGCKWYDGIDVCQAVHAAMQRLHYLRSITRQKTYQSTTDKNLILAWYFDQFKQPMEQSNQPAPVITPSAEQMDFIKIVRKHAERFYEIMNPGDHVERFLGNASMKPMPPQVGRCSRGMPSFKVGNYVFVSQRNIDKQFIDLNHFVPCYMDDDKLYYCGENKPSVDAPIQLRLYQNLPNIRYIIHSHCYIAGATFTSKSIPCGAIEEVDEVLRVIDDKYKTRTGSFYAINLKGHGSLLMAKCVDAMSTGFQYIGRELPETMCDEIVFNTTSVDTHDDFDNSNNDLPEWQIPITYTMTGIATVRAKTLEDAMAIAIADETELPSGSYVQDSCELAFNDAAYIREFYNNNQPDVT